MSRCAWKTLWTYAEAVLGEERVPGAIIAIPTYGDALNWHPHLHSVVSDVAWDRQGSVFPLGGPDAEVLTQLFQHHVLERLIREHRLSREFAHQLRSWHPTGFQVYCGHPVDGNDDPALERLTAYILRPSFAATRVQFDEADGQVEYRTPKGMRRSMDALDWIALVTSHIPAPHEQMVRYYGRYANASRGKRRPPTRTGSLPSPRGQPGEADSPAERFARRRRRNWARLLKKIYEVDPLRCPRCGNPMHIVAWIEGAAVIRKILQHLGLWERSPRSPPPRLIPHKLEALLATLTPQQAQRVRASTDSLFWDDVPVFND